MALTIMIPAISALTISIPEVVETPNVFCVYYHEESASLLRRRYEILLKDGFFSSYVKYHDAMATHTPMVTQTIKTPHMDKNRIQYLFSYMNNPLKDVILPFLINQYQTRGFVVIEDDRSRLWVYVGEDDRDYQRWLMKATETGEI